jgi:pSer/pThr/pTyr-binding forkhead associated (FHA) protein
MGSIANGELVPVGGGDSIPLIRDVLTLGRRDSCDIPLRRPNVSGLHCELSFRDGVWWLRDLGSTNGVKVNGTRVDKKRLLPGDTITIAKHNYTIHYTPPAGQPLVEDLMEDDILSKPLLEKAGLVRPEREDRPRRPGKGNKKDFDPAQFLLGDEEEDE